MTLTTRLTAFLIFLFTSFGTTAETLSDHQALALDIYRQVIAMRTAAGEAQTPVMANALAERFIDGGFAPADVRIIMSSETVANLVVTYRGNGTGGKAILLMAHMDVVPALRSDWSIDPYALNEVDGYYYGRGTTDNKAGVALLSSTFLTLKGEGFIPSHDLIIVFTGDEETTGNGISTLIKNEQDLKAADFALNSDGGGGTIDGDKALTYFVQASEKMYHTFELTVRSPGGHSSVPGNDNAIYRLASALTRLADFRFPTRVNEITTGYFREAARVKDGEVAEMMRRFATDPADEEALEVLTKDPYYESLTRTTCVATMLRGGHAENALPQTAVATVNCRIFPGISSAEVERRLSEVLADETIEISTVYVGVPGDPLRDDVMTAVTKVVHDRFPGIPIIPSMSTGATDGLFVRNAGIPVYGVGSMFGDAGDNRAHGRDERVRVDMFRAGAAHWYALLKVIGAP